jgi:hypothetical protein
LQKLLFQFDLTTPSLYLLEFLQPYFGKIREGKKDIKSAFRLLQCYPGYFDLLGFKIGSNYYTILPKFISFSAFCNATVGLIKTDFRFFVSNANLGMRYQLLKN